MTNKLDISNLKEIVHELGYVVWAGEQFFENWVTPRVNTLLQAIDELEALRAELASVTTQRGALKAQCKALKSENGILKAERDSLAVEKDAALDHLTNSLTLIRLAYCGQCKIESND